MKPISNAILNGMKRGFPKYSKTILKKEY